MIHNYGRTEYIAGGMIRVTCRACGVTSTSPGPAVDPECPGPDQAEQDTVSGFGTGSASTRTQTGVAP